ncbi:phage protein NinX family protein [Pseudocitrobacter faecalis]|uniref:phage protein NinX family protein n=1 Tax=Pseudocitrobacter faecalis TaxID=1398493 RepID=UPI00331548DA
MDYSQLSDFEINSAVHNAKLKEPYALVFMGDDRIAWTKENGDQIITDKVPYTKNGVHDYCNNPADAWPIIVEHHIAVVPYRHTLPQAWPTAFGVSSKFTSEDANPLRAAMIVFLKMQDAKHA